MSEAMRLTSTKWPRWLAPNWVSNPSAVLPYGQAMTPAFAMTRSNGLPLSTSALAQARTLSSDARSSSTSSNPPLFAPPARKPAVAALALLRSRAAPTTSAPWAASARAVSTPRPADTPVTSTRLPLKFTPSSTSPVVDVAPKVFAMIVSASAGIEFSPMLGRSATRCCAKRARQPGLGEALADQLLALRPQRLGCLRGKRIGAHAGEGEPGRVDALGDGTILAVAPADRVGLRDRRRPDGR